MDGGQLIGNVFIYNWQGEKDDSDVKRPLS